MLRPDGRLEPGQPLRGAISARAWNRAQDAADRVLGSHTGVMGAASSSHSAPYQWVYAYNGSSADVSRWDVLQINGMQIPPATNTSQEGNAAQFQEMPVLNCGTPDSVSGASPLSPRWCVAVEPIARFGVGRVAVSGIVQAKVNIVYQPQSYVRPQPGTTRLMTSTLGQARIIWIEPATSGVKWALIELGNVCHVVLKASWFDGPWAKDATKAVYVNDSASSGFDETFSVLNTLVDVAPKSSGGSCTLWSHDGVNAQLLAFDLSSLKGYGSGEKVLGIGTGGMQWFDLSSNLNTGRTVTSS